MADELLVDDLDLYQANLTKEERDEIFAASVALDLARLIYAAREQRGLTQIEAAKKAGVQQQMVSRLEGGTAQPTFKTVERYLRRLGFALQVSLIDESDQTVIDSVLLNGESRAGVPEATDSRPMVVEQR